MKPTIFALAIMLIVVASVHAEDPARAALQKLNDFVGEWKGSGAPDKLKADPRDMWKEDVSWAWKFKGKDAWLTFAIKDGKYLKSGELHAKPDGKNYELTVVDAKDQKAVYTGKRDDKGYLSMESVDAATGDTHQIVMNTAAEGVRFVYRFAVRPKGRTTFNKVYQVAATREGEALGVASSRKKSNECIVTGGLGTIAVSYKGKTYFVCCTGCKEAFESDPEKYIKEAEKK
jgi:YHS domain